MSRALATVRHNGRRPSVAPGTRRHDTQKPPKGGDRLRLRREPQPSPTNCLSPLRGWLFFLHRVPGADAPGYESSAASRLAIPRTPP